MNGRSILAVLAGVIGGGIIVFSLISLGHKLFPVDEAAMRLALLTKDEATIRAFFENLPLGNYVSVIVAHALGLVGGMVIGRLINKKELMHLIVIALIMVLLQVVNFLSIPHPSWFLFADLGTSFGLALGYLGYIWGRYKKA